MADSTAAGLIDLISNASFDDEAFGALPETLARSINARSCTIQFYSRDWNHFDFVWNHFTAAMCDDYVQEFLSDDIWLETGRGLPANQVHIMDQFIPFSSYQNSRFYNEFYRPNGDDTAHCMGALLVVPSGYVAMGIHRSHMQGAFFAGEGDAIQSLLPHIARLHQVRARLHSAESRARVVKGALDRFAFAAVVVRSNRTIVMSNAAAEKMFRCRDGVCAVLGRLGAVAAIDDRRLGEVIFHALTGSAPRAGALVIEREGERPAFRVVVTPICWLWYGAGPDRSA